VKTNSKLSMSYEVTHNWCKSILFYIVCQYTFEFSVGHKMGYFSEKYTKSAYLFKYIVTNWFVFDIEFPMVCDWYIINFEEIWSE